MPPSDAAHRAMPLQVVFKALLVLHTMIRNGATDNVLAYLSSSDVLRLKNISAGAHWEGELKQPSSGRNETKPFPPRLPSTAEPPELRHIS